MCTRKNMSSTRKRIFDPRWRPFSSGQVIECSRPSAKWNMQALSKKLNQAQCRALLSPVTAQVTCSRRQSYPSHPVNSGHACLCTSCSFYLACSSHGQLLLMLSPPGFFQLKVHHFCSAPTLLCLFASKSSPARNVLHSCSRFVSLAVLWAPGRQEPSLFCSL